MVRWLALALLFLLCLILGVVAGSKIASPLAAPTPTPPPTATPLPPSNGSGAASSSTVKLVVVLVNDTALGPHSALQTAWSATIHTGQESPLQIALAPLPLDHLNTPREQPWLLPSGLLNPAILEQLFHSAASQFHFVVFDLEALTDLLQRIGQVSVQDGTCQAKTCLDWIYEPGVDQATIQRRLQAIAGGVLRWAQEDPSNRATVLLQWLLENQGEGNLKTDIAPAYWSQWAGMAQQRGIDLVP